MLGRILRDVILSISVLIALALVAIGVASRGGDLLVGRASGGDYRELRARGGQFSYLALAGWNDDVPLHFGRAPEEHQRLIATKNTMGRPLMLLDGKSLLLSPGPATWWPPLTQSGNVFVQQMLLGRILLTTANGTTVPAVRYALPPTTQGTPGAVVTIVTPRNGGITATDLTPTARGAAASVAAATTEVERAAGRLTAPAARLPGAAPAPPNLRLDFDSLTLNRSPPTTAPAALATPAAIAESTSLTFRSPVKSTTPRAGPAALTITGGGTLTLAVPAVTYTAVAVPQWAAIAIVLLPVWVAVAIALGRWRRRAVRRRNGLCVSCGYDLRGTGGAGACPECGAGAASPVAAENAAATAAALAAERELLPGAR